MDEQQSNVNYRQMFDDAPCGYMLLDADGTIIRANNWISDLLGFSAGSVDGTRFRDVLTMPSRVLYETNLAPLLTLEQSFSEVTLDLRCNDGTVAPVIAAASCTRDESRASSPIRIVFMHAGNRRTYERELKTARDTAEENVRQYQADGELREQFIAVLGHDLRNPLASMIAATRILAKEAVSERGRQVIGPMQGSTARMSALIENVLDFARARLGSGIGLNLNLEPALEMLLDQVVEELRSNHPDHNIKTTYALKRAIVCDALKIGQLASNLLGNAISHGDVTQRVLLRAETFNDGKFQLSVTNGGSEIPPDKVANLFNPFVRGQSEGYKEGLGLGLFIAKEIAKAHNGSLTVESSSEETTFTFTMPTDPK